MNDQNFRAVKKRSLVRGILFANESVLVCAAYVYLLLWKGLTLNRTHLLAAYGIVYMIRLNLMAQWFLQREIATEELTGVMLIWLPAIMVSFALLSPSDELSLSTALISILSYGTGSFLNTYSELQRMYWKRRPENRGRCYTEGLFAFSRNINYLGDTVLFGGWALGTSSWWNAWVPLVMGLSFYYLHIPGKETYLAQRYREDWPRYAAMTKSFIPYVC